MSEKELTQSLRQALRERVERSCEVMRQEWLQLTPEELIKEAGNIDAANIARAALVSTACLPEIAELMRFVDPLAVLRDEWLFVNGGTTAHFDAVTYLIYDVLGRRSTYKRYELVQGVEPAYEAAVLEQSSCNPGEKVFIFSWHGPDGQCYELYEQMPSGQGVTMC